MSQPNESNDEGDDDDDDGDGGMQCTGGGVCQFGRSELQQRTRATHRGVEEISLERAGWGMASAPTAMAALWGAAIHAGISVGGVMTTGGWSGR